VSGELTLATEHEFTRLAAEAAAACRGPVLFDLSGLDFLDCQGARALARAVDAVRPRETGLLGTSATARRVLDALGFGLPYLSAAAGQAPGSLPPARPRPVTVPRSRGEALIAMTREAERNVRQSALHASEVMARLAASYSDLALNSLYRTEGKSDDRGRLLALSGRALDLSRRYLGHASGASAD
jgi:anti-anti-sigma factor